jgi:hypothetical protein
MCKFFSCIIKRENLEIVWDKDTSSHEDLIKKFNLKDDNVELNKRDFVRLEMTMNENTFFSSNINDWTLKVDEQGTVPVWYSKNENVIRNKLFKIIKELIKPFSRNVDKCQEFIKSIPKIKYFSMMGKVSLSWNLSIKDRWDAAGNAARDAAGNAARNAAVNAAGNAAGNAAWDAAWDAARNAARNAAWDAAGDAAGDAAVNAARNAAGNAAWDAAGNAARDAAIYCRCLLVSHLIDKKHLIHTKSRMDVWKKGYGLRCDVNGKLFVYGIKKK